MILNETFALSNGITIPKLGLGTWFISNEDVVQAVKDAAKIGYRHIEELGVAELPRGQRVRNR